MLLQLSAKVGLNTDNVINWKVSRGRVAIWVIGQGCSVQGLPCLVLNAAEGLRFLRHASEDVTGALNKLAGKETAADDKVYTS